MKVEGGGDVLVIPHPKGCAVWQGYWSDQGTSTSHRSFSIATFTESGIAKYSPDSVKVLLKVNGTTIIKNASYV